MDVIADFEEMLEEGLASDITELVNKRIMAQERFHDLKKSNDISPNEKVIQRNKIESELYDI